jgi:uncharacterized protein YukE
MNQRQALEMAQKVMQSWQGQAPLGFNEAFQAVNQALEQPAAWVGLTADEMLEALISVDSATKRLPIGFTRFAQAIEAKLREKNGGA